MKEIVTLKKLCDMAEVRLPLPFWKHAHVVISKFACFANRINSENSALFVRGLLENGQPASRSYNEASARKACANGARFIFSREQYYAEDGSPLPCILVDDPSAAFIRATNALRRRFPQQRRVVGVTGSIGKTTTTEMLSLVASAKYKTDHSKNNANGFASISINIQRLSPQNEVYIQEVGAYFPGLIEAGATMLEPDACVVTNIGTSHIDLYGSVEGITHDKLALTRHLRPGGMAFINYDDPVLRRQEYTCPVTWFSLDNPEADFYSANIQYGDGMIEYDIVEKGGATRTHIQLASYGLHNVINSVAAFAFGCWCGISRQEIANALLNFKTDGMRQNYCNIGGCRLYVDCFNSAPNSLESAVDTITRIPIQEGHKRVAVLGDMLKMGDLSQQLHTDCGKKLARYPVDLYLCYGPYMQYMARELEQAGRSVRYTRSREQLNEWVAECVQPGDLALFKSGHRMYLSKTIDQVFGTAFYLTDADIVLSNGHISREGDFQICTVEDSIEIRKYTGKAEKVVLPTQLGGATVVRIGADAFNRNKLKELVVGEGVTSIGFAAFYICSAMKKLTLPSTLRVIERRAFNYCQSLTELRLPEGLTTIGTRAFYDCKNLQKVVIGEQVRAIGKQAFANCKRLTIYGAPGSFAEQYAREEKIPFRPVGEE